MPRGAVNTVIVRRQDCATHRSLPATSNTILVGAEFLSHFHDLAEKAVYVSDGTMDVNGSIDRTSGFYRQIADPVSGVCGGEIFRALNFFQTASQRLRSGVGKFLSGCRCYHAGQLQTIGFPSLPSKKHRGIWRANLPWNDPRSYRTLF